MCVEQRISSSGSGKRKQTAPFDKLFENPVHARKICDAESGGKTVLYAPVEAGGMLGCEICRITVLNSINNRGG